jgi:hypothetical protein
MSRVHRRAIQAMEKGTRGDFPRSLRRLGTMKPMRGYSRAEA